MKTIDRPIVAVNLKEDHQGELVKKLVLYFKEEFPTYNFNQIMTKEEYEKRSWIKCTKNKDGSYTKTDKEIFWLSFFLLDYYKKQNNSELNTVAEANKICKDIIKRSKQLEKEISRISNTETIAFSGPMTSKFSNSSKLISQNSVYSLKNPVNKTNSPLLTKTFVDTINAYSEIEKTPEKILILSECVINDLVECFTQLEKIFTPKKGAKGRCEDSRKDIAILLGQIFCKCTGERPDIKRSGDDLSENHRFNKFFKDFIEEFNVQFTFSESQTWIREVGSFEQPTEEEDFEDEIDSEPDL